MRRQRLCKTPRRFGDRGVVEAWPPAADVEGRMCDGREGLPAEAHARTAQFGEYPVRRRLQLRFHDHPQVVLLRNCEEAVQLREVVLAADTLVATPLRTELDVRVALGGDFGEVAVPLAFQRCGRAVVLCAEGEEVGEEVVHG